MNTESKVPIAENTNSLVVSIKTVSSTKPEASKRETKRDPEKKKAKDKRYYEKHKEEISEKRKEYRSIPEVAEKISAQKKFYAEENKEEIKEYQNEYREKNKEKIKDWKTALIKCLVCEKVCTQQCWKKHTKTKFHIAAMKEGVEEKFELV